MVVPEEQPVRSQSAHSGRPAVSALSDKFIDMIVMAALPASMGDSVYQEKVASRKGRGPPFSVGLMNRNFSAMVTRIGPVFDAYYGIMDCISWKSPSMTLSWLSIYTFVCLNPHLLFTLPLAYLLTGIMVPAYVVRHKPPGTSMPDSCSLPADGEPLHEAVIPKPMQDYSREAFLNMVDIQNSMPEYSHAYDRTVKFLSSFAYFVHEPTSCLTYVTLLIAISLITMIGPAISHLIPWRWCFITVGWITVASCHPANPFSRDKPNRKQSPRLKQLIHVYSDKEFGYCGESDIRPVEVFEIQAFDTLSNCWLRSIFSPGPWLDYRYMPRKPTLTGAASINEVLAPSDWTFVGKAWALDLDPDRWLAACGASHNFVSNSLEKWVYDSQDGQDIRLLRRRRWVRNCVRYVES